MIRKLIVGLVAFVGLTAAATQPPQYPVAPADTVIGNPTGSPAQAAPMSKAQLTSLCNLFNASLSGCAPSSPGGTLAYLRADGTWSTPPGAAGGSPGGTAGQVQFNSAGSFGGFTIGGDAALNTGTGALTVTKTNGIAFAPSATTDATNAANIASGTLPAARLPNPSASTLGGIESLASAAHQWISSISTSGVPVTSQPAFSDITGAATLAQLPSEATGTVLGNVSGSSAAPSALTATQLTTLCNTFSATLGGCAPASGGGGVNFLRADGTWAAPAGGGGSGTPVVFVGASAGSANAYTLASPTPSGFSRTDQFVVRTTIPVTNTGASTQNVGSTGAAPIRKQSGSSIVDVAAGDLQAGQEADLTYNAGCSCFLVGSFVGSAISEISANTTVTAVQWATAQTYIATAPLSLTLPISSTLAGNSGIDIIAYGGAVALTPNASDAINGGTVGVPVTIGIGRHATLYTDSAGNIFCSGCGASFAPSATTDTTNASNITSGTLPAARLPLPTETTQSGTTYTLQSTDCGSIIKFTSSVAITVTLPNSLLPGCQVAMEQDGTGQVTPSPASGAAMHNAHGYTKSFGQFSIIGVTVNGNVGGAAANYIMTGDGA